MWKCRVKAWKEILTVQTTLKNTLPLRVNFAGIWRIKVRCHFPLYNKMLWTGYFINNINILLDSYRYWEFYRWKYFHPLDMASRGSASKNFLCDGNESHIGLACSCSHIYNLIILVTSPLPYAFTTQSLQLVASSCWDLNLMSKFGRTYTFRWIRERRQRSWIKVQWSMVLLTVNIASRIEWRRG